MKRITFVLVLVFIGTFTLAQVASAKTFSMPPIPEYSVPAWESGTSVTYDTTLNRGDNTYTFKFRVAVLDTEMEGVTPLYWVEFDIFDITGLPYDLGEMLTQYYGEAPYSVKLMALMPEYDLVTLITDPSKCYYDFTSPGFIRSMYFQYNRFVPYDVDPTLIGGFILPVMVSDIMGDEIPEDFLTARNLGIEVVQDSENFRSDESESEVTVGAGTFEGYRFDFSSIEGSGGAGMIFHSGMIPILPIVTLALNWVTGSATSTLAMELVQMDQGDAVTQLIGLDQAVRLDLQTLMYGS